MSGTKINKPAVFSLVLVCIVIFYFLSRQRTDNVIRESTTVLPSPKVFRSFYREMESFVVLDLKLETKTPRPLMEFKMEPWRIKPDQLRSRGATRSMVIFVKSRFNNTQRRNFARSTWASRNYAQKLYFETIFVVGIGNDEKALEEENKKHGDLLQIKYDDTYENLVYKSIAGMQWASENFPEDWFYSSMDDDVLPDFVKIVTDLENIISTEKMAQKARLSFPQHLYYIFFANLNFDTPVYCGFGYRVKTRPKRVGESKWYVTEENYPGKRYPPYCFGGFYSMTVKLATRLFNLSRNIQTFWIDDVWITGILRLKHFSDGDAKCATCDINNTTMGLWTVNSENYTAAVTGDEKFLMNNWGKLAKLS